MLKRSLSLNFKRPFQKSFRQLLISLMMKAGCQWIFSLNLGSKQRNRWHKTTWTFRNPKRAQNRIQVTFVITVCSSYFLFQFYFTLENRSWVNWNVESSFFRCRENVTKCTFKNIWQKCLKCSFSSNIYWIVIGKYLGRYFFDNFKLGQDGNMAFLF